MELHKATDQDVPVCPYCEQELAAILAKKFDAGLFKASEKWLYFCPHCQKVLGVGQWGTK